LASNEVVQGGSLNNGLKDQIKALQWVQKYISNVCNSLLPFGKC
jgi:carboxylesterase type B